MFSAESRIAEIPDQAFDAAQTLVDGTHVDNIRYYPQAVLNGGTVVTREEMRWIRASRLTHWAHA